MIPHYCFGCSKECEGGETRGLDGHRYCLAPQCQRMARGWTEHSRFGCLMESSELRERGTKDYLAQVVGQKKWKLGAIIGAYPYDKLPAAIVEAAEDFLRHNGEKGTFERAWNVVQTEIAKARGVGTSTVTGIYSESRKGHLCLDTEDSARALYGIRFKCGETVQVPCCGGKCGYIALGHIESWSADTDGTVAYTVYYGDHDGGATRGSYRQDRIISDPRMVIGVDHATKEGDSSAVAVVKQRDDGAIDLVAFEQFTPEMLDEVMAEMLAAGFKPEPAKVVREGSKLKIDVQATKVLKGESIEVSFRDPADPNRIAKVVQENLMMGRKAPRF